MQKPKIRHYSGGSGKVLYKIYRNGKVFHRGDLDEDGYLLPAWIRYHENGVIESEGYYVNGKCHRDDFDAEGNLLPAQIRYYEDGTIRDKEFWINGTQIYAIKFMEEMELSKFDKEALILWKLSNE